MRVLHLFDSHAGWEQRVAVGQLIDRLAPERHVQILASLDGRVPSGKWFDGSSVIRVPERFSLPILAAPALRRLIADRSIDVTQVWGPRALRAAAAARGRRGSLVLWQSDPYIPESEAKLFRSLADAGSFAVSCSCATVQRRLIEKGISPERCVVIRPGVDFGRINAAKKNDGLRQRLGLTPDQRAVVASEPVSRRGGHERVVWAGQLRYLLEPSSRLIVFGESREFGRLKRLSSPMPYSTGIIWAGSEYRYEDLVATADALVVAALDDVSTTSIAWAMAAGVPIVASAVYAVAELIAHKHNGLLIKPEPGQPMAVRIAAALSKIDSMGQEKQRARSQAYEVFSVRRFADQHAQLYENLTAGAPPSTNITDSAIEQ
ncbi:MAG: glycosyltransferase family 4 protein [Planctomycetes bacterium]|nr:glycosyltransferase family 4 protein [Planctomycetota bacterium]